MLWSDKARMKSKTKKTTKKQSQQSLISDKKVLLEGYNILNLPLRNREVFNNVNFQWEHGQCSHGKHPRIHSFPTKPTREVEVFLFQGSPSFPKPAFLVRQEPESQACLQEELQGCSWENRSSDKTQRAKPPLEVSRAQQKAFVGVPAAYSQSTPAHTSCSPC